MAVTVVHQTEFDVEIVCSECGATLEATSEEARFERTTTTLKVEPCEKCLDKKRDEGYEDGYDKGFELGKGEGRDEAEKEQR